MGMRLCGVSGRYRKTRWRFGKARFIRVRQEFGALEPAKDECRDEKPAAWADGLMRDVRYAVRSLREGFKPIAFLSVDQDGEPETSAQFAIRSSLPLKETTPAVREMFARTNPLITSGFRSFETQVEEGLLRERLRATLSGFSGVLGALIAAVGLYG